jgi:hypothetical protein
MCFILHVQLPTSVRAEQKSEIPAVLLTDGISNKAHCEVRNMMSSHLDGTRPDRKPHSGGLMVSACDCGWRCVRTEAMGVFPYKRCWSHETTVWKHKLRESQ